MVPTKEGYLRFLIESKVVYEAFEDIMANAPVPQCESLRLFYQLYLV